jgi:hypothetical protein
MYHLIHRIILTIMFFYCCKDHLNKEEICIFYNNVFSYNTFLCEKEDSSMVAKE